MARTLEGRRLTEAHRLAQVALSKSTVKDFLLVWKLLDPEALNASFPGYARAARYVIDANRSKSTALAQAYLDTFRKAEGATKPLTAARATALAESQALTSLTVTGPVKVYQGLRLGRPIEVAMRDALVSSTGAVVRHTLDAGRETVIATTQRDEEAYGFARVTDGQPCAFCAMLASRGAVYKSEATGNFECHDGCGCGVEPAYGEDDYLAPGRSQEFSDLYEQIDVTDDDRKTRNPAANAFRRLYEKR